MYIIWIILAVITAFFVAWNNGSNNTANIIGSAVGSGSIKLKKGLLISSLTCFIGAILLGNLVTETIMNGIVAFKLIEDKWIIVKGVLTILISTGIWIFINSIFKIPVSVHACIIGSVIGFGLSYNANLINWRNIMRILIAWMILPFISALISYITCKIYSRNLNKKRSVILIFTLSVFSVNLIFTMLILNRIFMAKEYLVLTSIIISLILTIFIYYKAKKYFTKINLSNIYYSFRTPIILASIFMAFSFGANDVSNAAAPLALILSTLEHKYSIENIHFSLIISALGLSIGIIMWGKRVIETIGERITLLSPLSAFSTQFATSISMIIFTAFKLPASTSISIVGSVIGVGLARGFKTVSFRTVIRIFIMWILLIPATMLTSYIIYVIIRFV